MKDFLKRASRTLEKRFVKWIEPGLSFSNEVLEHIFDTYTVIDRDGQPRPLYGHISVTHANVLYRSITRHRPRLVIEIGMANGISSLAILSALRDLNNGGRLISIDPFESTGWHGIGLLNVERASLAVYHRLIEEPDYLALPHLLKDNTIIDFAYLDGNHFLDYTMLDFFYVDKMLSVGGVIGFNDCALLPVRQVVRFLRTYRKYQELDVGLKPNFLSRNVILTMWRMLTFTSASDRYFQKQEEWEPKWEHMRFFP